jgi:hypothetical protein
MSHVQVAIDDLTVKINSGKLSFDLRRPSFDLWRLSTGLLKPSTDLFYEIIGIGRHTVVV